MDPTSTDDRLDQLEKRLRILEQRIPDSSIIDPRFWPRAFAVFGHSLAVSGLVYVGLILLVFVIGIIVGILGSPNDEISAMTADLERLVRAEWMYQEEHDRFAAKSALTAAGLWHPTTGVTATTSQETAVGFAAVATHSGSERACGVYVGRAQPPHRSVTKESEIACW